LNKEKIIIHPLSQEAKQSPVASRIQTLCDEAIDEPKGYKADNSQLRRNDQRDD